jgi:hypothetical protein
LLRLANRSVNPGTESIMNRQGPSRQTKKWRFKGVSTAFSRNIYQSLTDAVK